MKLCVLGGGGVRSCFLAKSIACNASLANLTEVVLMDVDQAKLDRYGKLARQIAIRIAPSLLSLIHIYPCLHRRSAVNSGTAERS